MRTGLAAVAAVLARHGLTLDAMAYPQSNTPTPGVTMKTATKRTTAGTRRLQNTVRRTRGQKTPTRIKTLAEDALTGVRDNTITVPDIVYALQTIAKLAGDIDARRAALDPSKGGKAV
jgi:hypothetical protein